jgi:hypothetical protein
MGKLKNNTLGQTIENGTFLSNQFVQMSAGMSQMIGVM